MIGLGALTAGGSAAFGTEAFTSVEAERNVDVTIAGDQSAFVAIEPLSGANAGDYVDTDGDTIGINLDSDSDASGEGVSQNAITQIEDLFRVVNQGSQPSSVYFEDSSDAVTFRVTQSTATSTTVSSGQTLEGADNSVELAVGEQVVVGMTIDTMNHDVSGDLLDNVTLYAEADREVSPGPETPQPQYVVTNDPDGTNEFDNIQGAIDAASPGAVIGVDGTSDDLSPADRIILDTANVTLTGFNGRPTIDLSSEYNEPESVKIDAPNVTVRNLDILGPAKSEGNNPDAIAITSKGAMIENNEISDFTTQIAFRKQGGPEISDIKIRGNQFTGPTFSIGQTGDLRSNSLTVTGNTFYNVTEGIGLGGEGPDILDVDGSDEIAQVIADNTWNVITGEQYAVKDYTADPAEEYGPDYTGDS